MTDDKIQSKSTERQMLIATVVTLLALAFVAPQAADLVDGFESHTVPRFIVRILAIVTCAAAIVWAWLRFREKTKDRSGE